NIEGTGHPDLFRQARQDQLRSFHRDSDRSLAGGHTRGDDSHGYDTPGSDDTHCRAARLSSTSLALVGLRRLMSRHTFASPAALLQPTAHAAGCGAVNSPPKAHDDSKRYVGATHDRSTMDDTRDESSWKKAESLTNAYYQKKLGAPPIHLNRLRAPFIFQVQL